MNDCIFCEIAAGRIPCTKVYEDEDILAFLDIHPVSNGHTLVIPKIHSPKLDECSLDILEKLIRCLRRIAGAVQKAVASDGYNVLSNNGRAAGQLVDHIHFHIIPRNTGDGVFSKWDHFQYSEGKAEILAEKIRQKL